MFPCRRSDYHARHSLPLTVLEWEEWGNPNDEIYYDYMKSYSPYDNVKSQDYPDILITAGLNDSRVKILGACQGQPNYEMKPITTFSCSKLTWVQDMVAHPGVTRALKR